MKPPADLARLQAAFGTTIATPLEFIDDEGNYTIQFDRYDPIATRAVEARGQQLGAQRLAVYNQQYWFRLLSIMQEEFPLTEALMGIQAFNRFAMAYLDTYPPDSVRLRDLSNRLSEFAVSQGLDTALQEAIVLERIYIDAFDAADLPLPDRDDPDTAMRLATEPLTFQPHLHLFEAQHNMLALRGRLRRGEAVGPEHVEEKPGTWVLWRGAGIQSVELGPIQAQLLREVIAGRSLSEAFALLEESLDAEQIEFLIAHVQRWFAAWGSAGWFAREPDL